MTKRRLRNAGNRKKALFGSETGAILAAAGINAATQLAAAAINSGATKQAAKDQAQATMQSAQRQAQAIKDQTQRNNEYQKESQEFIKEQNSENRELQRDIQLQLQMLTGQQNVNDRLEASKIKVKAGGKLKNRGYQQSLLRGGNMPFQVTDGGSVIPVGLTPEGYEMYEIIGNDHEHYHKTRGKYKSGVGIKFANGNVIEGEGNQNSSRGELMLVTPDDAYFISKHTIDGINPVNLVEQGIHPLKAFAIQEQQKAIAGIDDDGSKKAKCGRRALRLAGGITPYTIYNYNGPQLGVDTIGDTAVGVVYGIQNNGRRLKLGGKIRSKFRPGGVVIGNKQWDWYTGSWVDSDTNPTQPSGNTNSAQPSGGNVSANTGGNRSSFINKYGDYIGAGISGLGNLGGALITSIGNRRAARTLSDAYNRGSKLISDAYNSLTGIDMNSIRKEDYSAAHAMPALQAPVSFAASNIAGVDRQLQRRLNNAGRYSASGAAALDRMSRAEIDTQDQRNKIYSADQEQMQKIRQANAERITEAAELNARLDTEANSKYAGAYLDVLKYNNDINNTKILGSAGALAEGAVNSAGAISQAQTSNAQAWGSSLAGIGNTFGNTLMSRWKTNRDYQNVLIGADETNKVSAVIIRDDYDTARSLYNSYREAINRPDTTDNMRRLYSDYMARLETKFPRLRS